jgi:hypothetical protein
MDRDKRQVVVAAVAGASVLALLATVFALRGRKSKPASVVTVESPQPPLSSSVASQEKLDPPTQGHVPLPTKPELDAQVAPLEQTGETPERVPTKIATVETQHAATPTKQHQQEEKARNSPPSIARTVPETHSVSKAEATSESPSQPQTGRNAHEDSTVLASPQAEASPVPSTKSVEPTDSAVIVPKLDQHTPERTPRVKLPSELRNSPASSHSSPQPRVSHGIRFSSPAKPSLPPNPGRASVLALSVPVPEGFQSIAAPHAHFPLMKLCLNRVTSDSAKLVDPFAPTQEAHFVLMAEDLTLSTKPLTDEYFMQRSVEGLFTLQNFNSNRVTVLHKEKAKTVVKSVFGVFSDLIVQHPSKAAEKALYVATFYKVVDRIGYIFQLMAPLQQSESLRPLFYQTAENATIDVAVSTQSPLRGSLRMRMTHPTSKRLFEITTPSLAHLPLMDSGSDSSKLFHIFSRADSVADEVPIDATEVTASAEGQLVLLGSSAGEACTPRIQELSLLTEMLPGEGLFRSGHGSACAGMVKGSAVEWRYVSPVLEFALPPLSAFETLALVEHKFGDALITIVFRPLAVPDSPANNSTVALTLGYLFGESAEVEEMLVSECLTESCSVQVREEVSFPSLSVDEIVLTTVVEVSGLSRVLGEGVTLRFLALRTIPGEWLVVKSTIPNSALEGASKGVDLKDYVENFLFALRLH